MVVNFDCRFYITIDILSKNSKIFDIEWKLLLGYLKLSTTLWGKVPAHPRQKCTKNRVMNYQLLP